MYVYEYVYVYVSIFELQKHFQFVIKVESVEYDILQNRFITYIVI